MNIIFISKKVIDIKTTSTKLIGSRMIKIILFILKNIFLLVFVPILLTMNGCKHEMDIPDQPTDKIISKLDTSEVDYYINMVSKKEFVNSVGNIKLLNYFEWMDSLIIALNLNRNYTLTEYHIVHANQWILDSLTHTDYYYLKEKGIWSEDPKNEIIVEAGQQISIPDSLEADAISKNISSILLDINIPEFKLKIIQNDCAKYVIPIRVGKNQSKYLEMAGNIVDLRTKTGVGEIVRINKNPKFINPVDNRPYKVTKRDDGKITKLPNVPWLEPELSGIRHGQLLHPTTNLITIGQPSSNGCLGMRESDAWIVYYHAPLGTKINIHYDLKIMDQFGEIQTFVDIYPGYEKFTKKKINQIDASNEKIEPQICICTTN